MAGFFSGSFPLRRPHRRPQDRAGYFRVCPGNEALRGRQNLPSRKTSKAVVEAESSGGEEGPCPVGTFLGRTAAPPNRTQSAPARKQARTKPLLPAREKTLFSGERGVPSAPLFCRHVPAHCFLLHPSTTCIPTKLGGYAASLEFLPCLEGLETDPLRGPPVLTGTNQPGGKRFSSRERPKRVTDSRQVYLYNRRA